MTAARVAIGVMAYNEGRNIGRLLEALRREPLDALGPVRLVVVASGCTDETVRVAERIASTDGRVQLIVEPERRGKAVAINTFIAAVPDAEILVMESADTLPGPGAIAALLRCFDDPRVGMVGARPVPEDDSSTFIGYAVQLLWRLHHEVASVSPKQGELVAWRNVVPRIDGESAVDEAFLEAEIVRAGLRLAYAPDAIVHNRGPATVTGFIRQRRRIHAGHRSLASSTRYRPATRDRLRLVKLGLREVARSGSRLHWLAAVAMLELWASALGWWDHAVAHRTNAVWAVVEGTKELSASGARPLVTALVVAYEKPADIVDCVTSIKRNRYPALRIVVVDDSQSDHVARAMAEAHPDVEIVRIANEGLAHGFNEGVRIALAGECEHVVFMNDDVLLANDFIEHAVAVAATDPRAASVSGPVFYYDEPERLWYAGAEIIWWLGKTYHRGRRVPWGPAFRQPRRVGYTTGAAVLYRAAALRDVGPWDETYFLVFEESDWCVRASRRGWHHLYVPGPKAWHKVSASFGGEKAAMYLYFLFRNNIRFMRRHARPWHWPTFVAFFALESVVRYALGSLFQRDRARRERAIALALFDALRGRWGRGSWRPAVPAVTPAAEARLPRSAQAP